MKSCPICKVTMDETKNFCPNCGHPMVSKVVIPESKTMRRYFRIGDRVRHGFMSYKTGKRVVRMGKVVGERYDKYGVHVVRVVFDDGSIDEISDLPGEFDFLSIVE